MFQDMSERDRNDVNRAEEHVGGESPTYGHFRCNNIAMAKKMESSQ